MNEEYIYPKTPKKIIENDLKQNTDLLTHDPRIVVVYEAFKSVFGINNDSIMFDDVSLKDLGNRENPIFNISKEKIEMVMHRSDNLQIFRDLIDLVEKDANLQISEKSNLGNSKYFVGRENNIRKIDFFNSTDKNIFREYFGFDYENTEKQFDDCPEQTITTMYESIEPDRAVKTRYHELSKQHESYMLNKYQSLKNLFLIKYGLSKDQYDIYAKYMLRYPDFNEKAGDEDFALLIKSFVEKIKNELFFNGVIQDPKMSKIYFEAIKNPVGRYLIQPN